MSNLKLTSVETTEIHPRSIIAKDAKNDIIFTVWADGRATINGQDLYLEEINLMKLVTENFYTFFNNIKTQ